MPFRSGTVVATDRFLRGSQREHVMPDKPSRKRAEPSQIKERKRLEKELEKELEEGLEESFPASDPVAVIQPTKSSPPKRRK